MAVMEIARREAVEKYIVGIWVLAGEEKKRELILEDVCE